MTIEKLAELKSKQRVLLGSMQKIVTAQEAIKEDPDLALVWQNLYTAWVHLNNAKKTVEGEIHFLKKELKRNGSI